jgi:hypothetical protein
MSTKTDLQGAFYFKGVPQGQYTVRATSLIVQKQQTNSSNSPIRVQAGVKLNLPEIEIYSNRIEG